MHPLLNFSVTESSRFISVSSISKADFVQDRVWYPKALEDDDSFRNLVGVLNSLQSVAVAFSGGVDSAFLLYVSRQVLGRENVAAITSISPSLGSGEQEHCRNLAQSWDVEFRVVHSAEMDNPNYLANDVDRCYWCKVELMDAIAPIIENSNAKVVLGVNLDDLGDYRPGQKAAKEAGAIFPLVEAGYGKDLIRKHARFLDLEVWDRPQAACLSSRIPFGTKVSLEVLSKLDRAESSLHALGFSQVRVRHYDSLARIEFPTEDLSKALARRLEVVEAVKRAGYRYVTMDLEGFRSGNLNPIGFKDDINKQ